MGKKMEKIGDGPLGNFVEMNKGILEGHCRIGKAVIQFGQVIHFVLFAPMAQTIHIGFKEVSYENRNYNR